MAARELAGKCSREHEPVTLPDRRSRSRHRDRDRRPRRAAASPARDREAAAAEEKSKQSCVHGCAAIRGRLVCHHRAVEDLVALASRLVTAHPAVTGVEFAGSRSRGTHEALSDWDFAVETSDFGAVARDMPRLVEPLEPLGQQWEPLGHFPAYQVLTRGPTKVEYLFLNEAQEALPPVRPSPETLGAINTHFWGWIWWLTTKASADHHDLVAEHMPQLYAHLLRPMGIAAPPDSIDAAIAAFIGRRDALEREYDISLPRALEHEVLDGKRRVCDPN
jgi:predicted nucleotidyltransferase